MAYNNRNLLNKILEIQSIAGREYARGVPYTNIYKLYIKDQYHISYSCFNNYLSRNAKRELDLLDRREAERNRQLVIGF